MPKREAVSIALDVLKQDPRAGILLAEILGPAPGIGNLPPRLWEV
jgi:hypothetical protein